MKVLVVAAHPDDEVIGCGGTIAGHVSAGDQVHLLIMTQVYAPEWDIAELPKRQKEAERAAKILGIKEVVFGGFPTVKLNTVPLIGITNKIGEAIRRISPAVIYLPPQKDLNDDHILVCKAGIAAAKASMAIKGIYSYEVPTVFRYNDLSVNKYIDISRYMARKTAAMRQYRMELRTYPHPRSIKGLEIIAQERGLAIGCKYAEAFLIIREVVK